MCARSPIYFLIQRWSSPSAHLVRRKVERLVGSHYSSAVPGFGPKSFPRGRRGSHRSCGGSIGRAVAIYSEPTSAFTVAPLAARKVERLVGLFILFSAVLLWPIVLNVTVWSLFFALSMWKVQCTCGSLLFICPTSAFTGGALCAVRWNALLGCSFGFRLFCSGPLFSM